MQCFTFGSLKITADSEDQAKLISDELMNNRGRRIIVVYDNNSVQMLSLGIAPCDVFTQNGSSIDHVGKITGGTGQAIIQAAVDQIDRSQEHGAKIRRNAKRMKAVNDTADLDEAIAEFENKVPLESKQSFLALIDELCRGNISYRSEMYKSIGQVIPENWLGIIRWFHDNVMVNRGSANLFQLRKAFITTATRMAAGEVSNTMKGVVGNDKGFWSNYADENS